MKILIFENYQELCLKVAIFLEKRIRQNPKMVLGLASGGTVVGLYENLANFYQKKGLDFSEVKFFNLDEYLGSGIEKKNSFAYFIKKVLLNQVNSKKENISLLNGKTKNWQKECLFFEEKIERAGGIDLQILGLGANGHLAFNEPGSSFGSKCRLVKLTPQTRQDNSRFFQKKEDVPKEALTLGLANILLAKEIILLANGKQKARVVKALVKGKMTKEFPCSILQQHSKVTLFLDKLAASLL
ncbi:glucosamine-6-phosphate deaminase [bacterium (Candidatus Gribaldobacteria) CG10_big_fil_rev_8_21_14_0_10_37_21]|uniref:Glucosamine-6-phosphate deaminase n=1 Tax=bacterium (Candidatus Gribaldobacteria) CG10_big_fil_rev_8_21_14_0_10_37_21 TaxID=2014275 RepID=A0A2H0UVU5_9BACT|nr:MAG: glucosamine-6-phosphate deaminase [Parcubacteria group bacterium CG1_02_37_13]PIR90084.1 MAG: glucosamine-6-phosphate deaminase [bacterium (Candidatus Gribaldobacteria) CG10_big_fil_rev_8_21_14_0_10_37_21]